GLDVLANPVAYILVADRPHEVTLGAAGLVVLCRFAALQTERGPVGQPLVRPGRVVGLGPAPHDERVDVGRAGDRVAERPRIRLDLGDAPAGVVAGEHDLFEPHGLAAVDG